MEFRLWWVVFGKRKEPFWVCGFKEWGESWAAKWMKATNTRCSRICGWNLMETMGVLLFAFGFILWILLHSLFQSFNRFNFAHTLLVLLFLFPNFSSLLILYPLSCVVFCLWFCEHPLLVDWLLCAFSTSDQIFQIHM